jgi:hypothetical protein
MQETVRTSPLQGSRDYGDSSCGSGPSGTTSILGTPNPYLLHRSGICDIALLHVLTHLHYMARHLPAITLVGPVALLVALILAVPPPLSSPALSLALMPCVTRLETISST